MKSIYCFGEVLVDFIPNESGMYQPFAGGAPANVAVGVAKLGGESNFVGGISQDNMGTFLLNELNIHGVNTTYSSIKPNKTALVLITLNHGERSFDFYRDDTADMALNKADIFAVNLPPDSIVHFCSNTLTTQSMTRVTHELLNRAKSVKACVSFDVNLRLNLWNIGSDDNVNIGDSIEKCFEFCNIVKLAIEELEYLSEQCNLTHQAYIKLIQSYGVELILITDGANPIAWYTQCNSSFVQPPRVNAIDTTAAGDSFVSGFLYQLQQEISLNELLLNEKALSKAILFASECGAYTVQHYGAFSALPSLEDLSVPEF